ncbi:MAG: lamin tail domain-containing protein [bacterium]|nr:lamin tail domain-containing protein [bacterium]
MKTVINLHRLAKYLLKYFREFCGKRRQASSGFFISAATVIAIVLPSAVSAQVVINEIAWMGIVGNANAEWIELYNTGASLVSLEEWTLTAQDGSPNIVLSGTVAAGGFFLLERTSDDTVPGFAAGVIYAGSLSNSGETLLLKNAGGTIVDTVVGGENWQGVGGDNVTKQTAQKTTNGWTTTAPTPGAANAGGSSGNSDTGDNSDANDSGVATTTEQSTGSGGGSGDSVMPPPPKVFADGGSDRTVVVGADTEFRARAYDEKKNLIDFSRFHWNFGDGSVSEVATVLHSFEYPGRYVVVLDMPEEKDAAADQIIVTVERVQLTLTLMQDGGVMIENRAGRTLDLSRWIVRSHGQAFTIPDHTFILAGSPLRISQKTLGFSSGPDIELDYPNGVFALGTVPPSPTATSTPAPVAQPEYGSQTAVVRNGEVAGQTVVNDDESAVNEPEMSVYASSTQVASAVTPAESSSRMWLFGAFGIAGLAAGSLVIARRYGKKEWDIEEMSETR